MTGSGNTTVPSATEDPVLATAAVRHVLGFVLLYSRYEPHRVGEFFPCDEEKAPAWTFGRFDIGDPDSPSRLHGFRQQPDGNVDCGQLFGKNISRDQLTVRRVGIGLEVTNIGEAKVFVGQAEVPKNEGSFLTPGTMIRLRGHSVLMVISRPVVMPHVPSEVVGEHAFGEPDPDGIVGESKAAWIMRGKLAAAVFTRLPVFLHGPTGCGKELAARLVHRLSGRKGKFVAVNCAALPAGLIESLLFGNIKNYPNPPAPERLGHIREADGGTIFLDEFGELPEELQSRLLRAMEGEVTPLGGDGPRKVDVLIVAATNRDLSRIKHDILKRFGTIVELPSFAERLEDVPLVAQAMVLGMAHGTNTELAARFVKRDAQGRESVRFAPALVQDMVRCHFEGNARDLRNLLLAAMTESRDTPPAEGEDGPTLMSPSDLTLWRPRRSLAPPAEDGLDVNDLLEGLSRDPSRDAVVRALAKNDGAIGKTAEDLGIDRHKLRRLMQKYKIELP